MDKPTPGPWEVIFGVLLGDHILIRGDGDYAVAKVYNEEPGMEAANAANARLIAAAPELLEALSEMQREWHHIIGCASPRRFHEINARAESALAKARGETTNQGEA